jgi:hypothetical protein
MLDSRWNTSCGAPDMQPSLRLSSVLFFTDAVVLGAIRCLRERRAVSSSGEGRATRRVPWLVLLASVMMFGCGLTGGTSKFVIDTRSAEVGPAVRIASITLDPDDSRLVTVGTYAWGGYRQDDLDVLRQSMSESAASASGSPPSPPSFIHVVIRRFLVATGSSHGLAIACVSWALTAGDGTLVYDEQFYASSDASIFGTVGGVKNDVHRAIARRVLDRASLIAAQPSARSAQLPRPDDTFDTYEDAVRELPTSLTSWGRRLTTGSTQLAWARRDERLDWSARLSAKR